MVVEFSFYLVEYFFPLFLNVRFAHIFCTFTVVDLYVFSNKITLIISLCQHYFLIICLNIR